MISATPHHDRLKDVSLPTPDDAFFDKIVERIDSHHRAFAKRSPDYYQEVYEFGTSIADASRYKAKPFSDWYGLMDCHFLGHVMRNSSACAQAVLENLTSYVVGEGITYTVKAKPKYRNNSETVAEVEQAQEDINQLFADECWPEVQEEAFRDRLITTGELLAEFDSIGSQLAWAFVDSHEIRPPEKAKRLQADRKNAPYGIKYRTVNGKPSSRHPETYYRDGSTPIPVERIAHVKINGDSRDPRGWPLFYAGYCTAKEVDELDYAATRSAIRYSRNTVVRQYNEDSDVDLMKVARQLEAEDEYTLETEYNVGGGEALIRGGNIHGLAGQWSARGFIELCDFKIRTYGNIGGVPEFISTGKADIGNRATLISSESPLTRRVKRMAMRIVKFDLRLIHALLAIKAGVFGTARHDAWLADFKSRITITPVLVTPDGRDKDQKDRLELDKLREGYVGPLSGIRSFGQEPEEVIEERRKWAEMEGQLREDLRDSANLNDLLSAEELRSRIDTAAALITIGFTEDEALSRAGVDPLEDRTALEEAIERRRQMQEMADPTVPPGEEEEDEE